MQILSAEYEQVLAQSSELLSREKDLVANAANLSALLFEALEAVDWVGIYFLRNGELVLGPFQGRAVAPRLSLGRSDAGRVVRDLRSIITEGRTANDGDSDMPSQAQVIVPILLHDRCVGVLEIDSPFAGRFNDHDRGGLEALARLLIELSDTAPLLPRRATITELRAAAPTNAPTAAAARDRLQRDPEKSHEPAATHSEPVTTFRGEHPTHKHQAPAQKTVVPAQLILLGITRLARLRQLPTLIVAGSIFVAALHDTLPLMPSATVTGSDVFGHAFVTIISFGILGTAIAAAWRMHIRAIAAITTAYAAILVIIQSITGAQVNGAAHAGDLACALLGGYLGATIGRALRRRSPLRQKVVELHRP